MARALILSQQQLNLQEISALLCSVFPHIQLTSVVCHSFYQENLRQVISKLKFCHIFKPAWLKAVTPENIINGFKRAGVFLLIQVLAMPLPKPNRGDGDTKHYDGGGGGADGDSTIVVMKAVLEKTEELELYVVEQKKMEQEVMVEVVTKMELEVMMGAVMKVELGMMIEMVIKTELEVMVGRLKGGAEDDDRDGHKDRAGGDGGGSYEGGAGDDDGGGFEGGAGDGGEKNHSYGAGIGHGDRKRGRDDDEYLWDDNNGGGCNDFSGEGRGDQSSSDVHKSGDTFTAEQVEWYTCRRFEEGYDLYDPAYVAWLEVTRILKQFQVIDTCLFLLHLVL